MQYRIYTYTVPPFPSSWDLIIGIHEVGAAFAIIRGAFTIYMRGAFAIIRSGSSIKCGAFNIIRDHGCFLSTLFSYTFHGMYMINDCLTLVCG
jgi:hypothetical protein